MFNAIEYTQKLEKAGFSRTQAEAAINMLHQFADQGLAIKQDISGIKQEISDLKHSIEMLEYKLTIKLGTMLGVAIGILVALQKLV